MASLKEIAQVSYDQLFPHSGDEGAITREHVLSTAKSEYAYQSLLMYWKQKREEGECEIPSHFLMESDPLPVEENEIDISDLEIFRTFPADFWLQNVGGLICSCNYVRSTPNRASLLCDDDSLADNERRYIVVGEKIKFPDGTHTNELQIIYASKGSQIDGNLNVDEAIAGIVRTRLIEIFGGKTGKEDSTNDSSSNT